MLPTIRLSVWSGDGSGALRSGLWGGLRCHGEILAAWLLTAAKLSSEIPIHTFQTNLVQHHRDAGNLQPLKKPSCAMQLLSGRRPGLDHEHSCIYHSRKVLGVG